MTVVETVVAALLATPKWKKRAAKMQHNITVKVKDPYTESPGAFTVVFAAIPPTVEGRYGPRVYGVGLSQMPAGCGMLVASSLYPLTSGKKEYGEFVMDLLTDVVGVMSKRTGIYIPWGKFLIATTTQYQPAANKYFQSRKWTTATKVKNPRTRNTMSLWWKTIQPVRVKINFEGVDGIETPQPHGLGLIFDAPGEAVGPAPAPA